MKGDQEKIKQDELWAYNCELMLTYDTPAYMFNVYKNQLSWQTGSRNLTGSKTLTTIWHTYMKLVTKYQISAINNCWEKCDEKYLGTDGRTYRQTEGRTDIQMEGWTDGRMDRGKTVYPPPPVERGYNKILCSHLQLLLNKTNL
jgi:hypothetical protein